MTRDIVERLRACHGIQSGDPECNCLEAADEIERLRAALKPFAEMAREWDGEPDSLEVELRAYDTEMCPGVNVADFRAARAALDAKP